MVHFKARFLILFGTKSFIDCVAQSIIHTRKCALVFAIIVVNGFAKLQAQEIKSYWAISTTPASFINPDPYIGLSLAHTNLKLKSTVQVSGGYIYKGNWSTKCKSEIEQIQIGGVISSLDYGYSINETDYVSISTGIKYSELTGLQAKYISANTIELVPYKETKLKKKLCIAFGTRTKYKKLGYYFDFSGGLGVANKQYYQNNESKESGYALSGDPVNVPIMLHGFATLRIGYRVSFTAK
jgi:hypothetical protein